MTVDSGRAKWQTAAGSEEATVRDSHLRCCGTTGRAPRRRS